MHASYRHSCAFPIIIILLSLYSTFQLCRMRHSDSGLRLFLELLKFKNSIDPDPQSTFPLSASVSSNTCIHAGKNSLSNLIDVYERKED